MTTINIGYRKGDDRGDVKIVGIVCEYIGRRENNGK
jgi:hypothetical protein